MGNFWCGSQKSNDTTDHDIWYYLIDWPIETVAGWFGFGDNDMYDFAFDVLLYGGAALMVLALAMFFLDWAVIEIASLIGPWAIKLVTGIPLVIILFMVDVMAYVIRHFKACSLVAEVIYGILKLLLAPLFWIPGFGTLVKGGLKKMLCSFCGDKEEAKGSGKGNEGGGSDTLGSNTGNDDDGCYTATSNPIKKAWNWMKGKHQCPDDSPPDQPPTPPPKLTGRDLDNPPQNDGTDIDNPSGCYYRSGIRICDGDANNDDTPTNDVGRLNTRNVLDAGDTHPSKRSGGKKSKITVNVTQRQYDATNPETTQQNPVDVTKTGGFAQSINDKRGASSVQHQPENAVDPILKPSDDNDEDLKKHHKKVSDHVNFIKSGF